MKSSGWVAGMLERSLESDNSTRRLRLAVSLFQLTDCLWPSNDERLYRLQAAYWEFGKKVMFDVMAISSTRFRYNWFDKIGIRIRQHLSTKSFAVFDKKFCCFRQNVSTKIGSTKPFDKKRFSIRQTVRQNRSTKIVSIFDKNVFYGKAWWFLIIFGPTMALVCFWLTELGVRKCVPRTVGLDIFVEVCWAFCRSSRLDFARLSGDCVGGWQCDRKGGCFGSVVASPDTGVLYFTHRTTRCEWSVVFIVRTVFTNKP